MITYVYRCSSCNHEFETEQSIKDKPKKKCPSCKKNTLERLICSPMAFMDREVTTIGQQADHNAKKLGKAEISEREAKYKESTAGALEEAKKERNQMHRKINKMSDKQRENWIINGD